MKIFGSDELNVGSKFIRSTQVIEFGGFFLGGQGVYLLAWCPGGVTVLFVHVTSGQ